MFKRILVPTDGSKLAEQAAHAAVELAKYMGAGVVGFVSPPPYKMRVIEDAVFAPGTLSEADFNKAVKRTTKKYLGAIEKMAREAGVEYEGYCLTREQPALGIVEAADYKLCDLICMGSHGRSGLVQIFLGSVTTKVLSMCTLPVLVHRVTRPSPKKAKRGALKSR